LSRRVSCYAPYAACLKDERFAARTPAESVAYAEQTMLCSFLAAKLVKRV